MNIENLTDEERRTLLSLLDKVNKRSPFDIKKGEDCYALNYCGELITYQGHSGPSFKKEYEHANICRDKKLMQKRGEEEILNRKIWRASIEYTYYFDSEEDGKYYEIVFDVLKGKWIAKESDKTEIYPGKILFKSVEMAERCIREVVIPNNYI